VRMPPRPARPSRSPRRWGLLQKGPGRAAIARSVRASSGCDARARAVMGRPEADARPLEARRTPSISSTERAIAPTSCPPRPGGGGAQHPRERHGAVCLERERQARHQPRRAHREAAGHGSVPGLAWPRVEIGRGGRRRRARVERERAPSASSRLSRKPPPPRPVACGRAARRARRPPPLAASRRCRRRAGSRRPPPSPADGGSRPARGRSRRAAAPRRAPRQRERGRAGRRAPERTRRARLMRLGR
jgi:hypothetical protein